MVIANPSGRKTYFDGLDDAEVFTRGVYFSSGYKGMVEVKKVHVIDSRKSGDLFTVEFIVHETNQTSSEPIGSKRTWQQKLADKAVAFDCIAKFAASCVGVDPNNIDEVKEVIMPGLSALMYDATENPEGLDKSIAANIFIGRKVRIVMRDHTTQKNKDIVVPDFEPFVEAAQ